MQNFDVTALQKLPAALLRLLTDPLSNLYAALALYGIIAVGVLILLVGAIFMLMDTSEDEEEVPAEDAGAARDQTSASQAALSVVMVLVVAAAVLIATGVGTAGSALCIGCHDRGPHIAKAKAVDLHKDVACISCHEAGGLVGQYTWQVPSRISHALTAGLGLRTSREYGRVTTAACADCHASRITRVTVNEQTGVKMSHKEPLKAGAQCLDCHRLDGGLVTATTTGMNSCLRCHDAKTASSDCGACHDKKTAAATRARSTKFAAARVTQLKCGGCHDEKTQCDTCHGLRMPHSDRFMAYAHARAGAADIWYNGGKGCAKCHYPGRRPCTKCHTPILGKGHPLVWATEHQKAKSAAAACDGCHQSYAFVSNRQFCRDLCHNPDAVAESPR
jgi:hypothetical protein